MSKRNAARPTSLPPRAPDPRTQGRTPTLDRIRSTETEMVRLAGLSDPTDEQLHRFHRRLRRLRVEFRLVRSFQPPRRQPAAREVERRLRRLSRLIGGVRDSDVSLGIISSPGVAPRSGPSRDAYERVRRRVLEEARSGRTLLGTTLRTELNGGLLRDALTLSESATPKRTGLIASLPLGSALRRQRRQVTRALLKARRRPTVQRLHQLRCALRRARYLVDLSPTAHRTPSRLARLQRELGRLHDLDIVSDRLQRSSDELGEADWVRRIDRQRRELRRTLATELDRRAVRERVGEIGT